MSTMVMGLFNNQAAADVAVNVLLQQGYENSDLSVVTTTNTQTTSATTATDTDDNIAEGAMTGATTGGIAGLLLGIAALSIPGLGALFIGGPLAAALGLSGAAASAVSGAVTGALAGGLVGSLVGLGVPEKTAQVYENSIKEGGVLVAVETGDDKVSQVQTILTDHGASDITTVKS